MSLREAVADVPDSLFVDVLESDDAYRLTVDVPGVGEDTLDVTPENGRLVIEGRRRKDLPTEYRYVREDRPLFLDATLPLPPDADAAATAADLDRGVLTLRVPKTATEERRGHVE